MDKDRLNDIRGIAAHVPCNGQGCDICGGTGTNYRVSTNDWVRIKDELVSEVDRLARELRVVTNFRPTPDHINKLPDALRDYICQLETSCDPTYLSIDDALRVVASRIKDIPGLVTA